jgi:hypothetical protein
MHVMSMSMGTREGIDSLPKARAEVLAALYGDLLVKFNHCNSKRRPSRDERKVETAAYARCLRKKNYRKVGEMGNVGTAMTKIRDGRI